MLICLLIVSFIYSSDDFSDNLSFVVRNLIYGYSNLLSFIIKNTLLTNYNILLFLALW